MLFFSFLDLFPVNNDESTVLSVSQITYLIQHLRVESQLSIDCATPFFFFFVLGWLLFFSAHLSYLGLHLKS